MKLVLHIGIEKTGSTSIQNALVLNASALTSLRLIPIRSFGFPNAIRLALITARPSVVAALANRPWDDEARAVMRADVTSALTAELRDHDPSATYVLSNEHCHSRVTSLDETHFLREFLSRWFDDVRVVVFLRRQDRLAASAFSTRLRAGGVRSEVIASGDRDSGYFNYATLIDRYAAAFGSDNLTVRIYRERWQQGPSALEDFMEFIGADASLSPPPRENSSLDSIGQELLRRINEAGASGTVQIHDLQTLTQAIEVGHTGPGRRPAASQARHFLESFAASNEHVRSLWFPERESLFDEDFSDYPEQPDEIPNDTDLLQASLSVIGQLAR